MELNEIQIQENEVIVTKLNKYDRRKLRVIKKLINGEFNGTVAAKKLKITTRQVRNLKRQITDNGDEGVVHKNRFNKPANTYDEELRIAIAKLYRKEFRGTNFTKYARYLQNEKGYDLSRSTIYNILREQHIRSPQRKKKKNVKNA